MLKLSFLQTTPAIVVALILFVLIILSYLIGRRFRQFEIARNPEHEKVELGTINGMLLGLLGLLLAFSFSMSNSRYDDRRKVVVDEANIIGTVVLRTDVYPDSMRKLLRAGLRDYVESRIAFYEAGMDTRKIMKHFTEADSIGMAIWAAVATYARVDDVTSRTSELIPALNAMIDIRTTRRAVGESTIPDSILYFLFVMCICSGFLLGYDQKGPISWVVVVGFSLILSATVFTIIDLDRPRGGLVDLDTPNQKIVELRSLFK